MSRSVPRASCGWTSRPREILASGGWTFAPGRRARGASRARRRSAARSGRRGRCAPSRRSDSRTLRDLEARVGLLPQRRAQLAVVEARPAPRQPEARRAVRRVERHALELLADRALDAHRVQPRRRRRAGGRRALADLVAVDARARRRRRRRARARPRGRRSSRRRSARRRAPSSGVRSAPRSVARRVIGGAPPPAIAGQVARAHADAAAEHVAARRLGAVEDPQVRRARQPDARSAPDAGAAATAGSAAANSARARATCCATTARSAGVARRGRGPPRPRRGARGPRPAGRSGPAPSPRARRG